MAETSGSSKIYSIQVLRGFAATAVVLNHTVRAFTTYHVAGNHEPLVFASPRWEMLVGVDVFFVISGFVMFYISGPFTRGWNDALEFMLRRIGRIYPMYLLATCLAILFMIIALWRGSSNTAIDLSPGRILASLFFVPSIGPRGTVAPLLSVGWTLTFEMYFYAVFSVCLALFRNRAPLAASLAMAAIFGAAKLAAGDNAIGLFLKDAHVFEFILGMGLGWAFKRWRIRRYTGILLLFFGILILLFEPLSIAADWDWLCLGVPAAALVGGCLGLEGDRIFNSRAILLLGDASYSVYLLHLMIVYEILIPATRKIGLFPAAGLQIDSIILAMTAVSVAVGLGAYQALERPLTRLTRIALQNLCAARPLSSPASAN